MSLTIPVVIQDALEFGRDAFYLVYIAPDIYITSYYRDLTIGGRNYLANGALAEVDPPPMTSSVDRQLFKIGLLDSEIAYGAQFDLNYMGRAFEVRLGAEDEFGNVSSSLNNTLLVYGGEVESISYEIDPQSAGRSMFFINGSSPMGDLDAINAYRVSNSFMEREYPGDTSFVQAYEGPTQISLRWGKA